MQIRFWGTRGSIPKPGPQTVRYGGNTSCVEVRSAAGTLVILDCGTGAHGLGQELMRAGGPLRGHILVGHTHWDHIQGLPFFTPLFVSGNDWDIYAPRGLRQSVRETLSGQMQYAYFPVTIDQLGANIQYHELVEGSFEIEDIRITTQYLNHPALTLGYRLEVDGVTLVYSTDHEPYSRRFAAGGFEALDGEELRHAEFIRGADLLVHDAQYTAKEYSAKVGWGHSTVEYVVDLARAMDVARLALFHHDPLRDDEAIDSMVDSLRERDGAGSRPLEIFAAAEGQKLEITGSVKAEVKRAAAGIAAATSEPAALIDRSVLVAVTDPNTVASLSEAVKADGSRLLIAEDGEAAFKAAVSKEPSLVILEQNLAGRNGLDVCRSLRNEGGAYGSTVPVVLVSSTGNKEDSIAGREAGVTDWLIRPFSSTYARTRVRAWLMRRACHWRPAQCPPHEATRLRSLRDLGILDTKPEERFDRITRLTAASFDVPVALVSLVDAERQWFKSTFGVEVRETPREVSFCAHAILGKEVLVVPDTLRDERFADNPLVVSDPHIRFYAGFPLFAEDGNAVGTLCIIDSRPRHLDEKSVQTLKDFGTLVQMELEMTRKAKTS